MRATKGNLPRDFLSPEVLPPTFKKQLCLEAIPTRPKCYPLCHLSNQSALKQKPSSFRGRQVRALALNPPASQPPLPQSRTLPSPSQAFSTGSLPPLAVPFLCKWICRSGLQSSGHLIFFTNWRQSHSNGMEKGEIFKPSST